MAMRRLLTAILLACCLLPVPCRADDLQQKLENLQRQAEEQQEETQRIQGKIDSVSEQLRALSASVDEAQAVYSNVRGQLDDTEEKISTNEDLLIKTTAELRAKDALLKKRVRNIYKHGQVSYIDVLFGARDFNDFFTRMDLLSRVLKADFALVQQVRAQKKVIEETRVALEQERRERTQLVREAAAREAELHDRKREKDSLLERMEYDRDVSEQAYQELMAASKEVERLIAQQRYRYEGPAGGGAMVWPLVGTITSEFGWRTHPITGDARFHSGLDIGGDYGEPIVAAQRGTVIYAGWISGYGYAVIIDHGGGITTLYGHNGSLAVSEGQQVQQEQVIAYCGSTGNSTGPHCHFEVRLNGEPVSPYGYL